MMAPSFISPGSHDRTSPLLPRTSSRGASDALSFPPDVPAPQPVSTSAAATANVPIWTILLMIFFSVASHGQVRDAGCCGGSDGIAKAWSCGSRHPEFSREHHRRGSPHDDVFPEGGHPYLHRAVE